MQIVIIHVLMQFPMNLGYTFNSTADPIHIIHMAIGYYKVSLHEPVCVCV